MYMYVYDHAPPFLEKKEKGVYLNAFIYKNRGRCFSEIRLVDISSLFSKSLYHHKIAQYLNYNCYIYIL